MLEIFLFLVPAPFIHLALRKACNFCHFVDFFLGPVHFAIELLFKDLDLDGTFSFTFFYAILLLPITVVLTVTHV